jgi:hypothetical protein
MKIPACRQANIKTQMSNERQLCQWYDRTKETAKAFSNI